MRWLGTESSGPAAAGGNTAKRVRPWLRFEVIVVSIGVVYIALRLSPSSYMLALLQLGAYESPYIGSPRPIRYDEWAVLTPQFQAAVANGFHVVNDTSFYGETLLGTSGLPLINWGLIFKPQVWMFFLVSPAVAYSVYWSVQFVAFLCGWSLLLRRLGFKATTAAIVAVMLFLTPFVQAWWSGFGFQLAIFPWVVWLIVSIQSNVRLIVALALILPVWFIGQFYVPGVPPLILLGVALILAFRPSVVTLRRCAAVAVGGAIGGAITLVYFYPVFHAFSDSVYPGSRWTLGGALSPWQALTQIFPGLTTEGFEAVVGDDICGASVVSSWLPAMAIWFVRWRSVAVWGQTAGRLSLGLRPVVVMTALAAAFALWQLAPAGAPLSYVLGLGLSTEQRALFAAGAPLMIAAAWAIERFPVVITVRRVAAFFVTVMAVWAIASIELYDSVFAFRDELIVLLPLTAVAVAATVLAPRSPSGRWRAALMLTALTSSLPWLIFNPVQSTTVMFRKPDTAVTRSLDHLAARRPDGAIAPRPLYSGAILNGVGYRAVTHAIATPSPDVFRRFFPGLPESYFETEFNRYIQLVSADVDSPELRTLDVVWIPNGPIARFASVPDSARDVPWDRVQAFRAKHKLD